MRVILSTSATMMNRTSMPLGYEIAGGCGASAAFSAAAEPSWTAFSPPWTVEELEEWVDETGRLPFSGSNGCVFSPNVSRLSRPSGERGGGVDEDMVFIEMADCFGWIGE